MARRMSAYRGEYADSHPSFHDNSAAACKRHDGPITDDSKIIYSAEDDEEIEHWIRDTVISAWNSSSTCPMRAREEFGVVDSKLNVYGVEGLKIAGESVLSLMGHKLISRHIRCPAADGDHHDVGGFGHWGEVRQYCD